MLGRDVVGSLSEEVGNVAVVITGLHAFCLTQEQLRDLAARVS